MTLLHSSLRRVVPVISRCLAGALAVLLTGTRAAAAEEYTMVDSNAPGGPVYEWVDIRFSGQELIGSGESGSAELEPEVPLLIHGHVWGSRHYGERLVTVSLNGYVDGARGSGSDITPSCTLPEPGAGTAAPRLYGYHADLKLAADIEENPAGVFYQYFHQSPHPEHPGGVHVFQWQRVERQDSQGGEFSFQILVFDNGNAVYQYRTAVPAGSGHFTIGTQYDDEGATYATRGTLTLPAGNTVPCNTGNLPAAGLAVAFRQQATQITSLSTLAGRDYNWASGKFVFAAGLNGQTLALPRPTTYFEDGRRALILDASALPDGVTLEIDQRHLLMHREYPDAGGPWVHGRTAPPLFFFCNVNFAGGDEKPTSTGGAAQMHLNDSATVLYSNCRFRRGISSPGTSYSILYGLDLWATTGTNEFGEVFSASPVPVAAAMHLRDCSIERCSNAVWLDIADGGISLRDCTVSGTQGHLFAIGRGNAARAEFYRTRFIDVQQVMDTHLAPNTAATQLAELKVEDCEFIHPQQGGESLSYFDTGSPQVSFRRCTATHAGPATAPKSLLRNQQGPASAPPAVFSHCTLNGTDVRAGMSRTYEFSHCTLQRSTDGPFVLGGTVALNVPAVVQFVHCILAGGSAAAPVAAASARLQLHAAPHHNCLTGAPPGFSAGNNLLNSNPLLRPLNYNGGFTQTMLPLRSSPVVDAGDATLVPGGLDQRGLARVVDGDGNGSARVDIGAVELPAPSALVVTTATDETATPGTGLSLREALTEALPGDEITFAPALAGAVLTLTQGPLRVAAEVEINATALPGGVTLTGSAAQPGIIAALGQTLVVRGLHFTAFRRGIVLEDGAVLTAEDCTFSGHHNAGGGGGAIAGADDGIIVLRRCTVRGCSAGSGGAVYGDANNRLTLEDCWLHENAATTGGGAVRLGAGSSFIIERCALTRNAAPLGGGLQGSTLNPSFLSATTLAENTGGALFLSSGSLAVNYCTIAGNSGGGLNGSLLAVRYYHCLFAGNELDGVRRNFTGGTSDGWNLSDGDEAALSFYSDRRLTSARLSPLGWHGGPTPTCIPLEGSPAINGGADIFNLLPGTPASDQRGYSRVTGGLPDIGAVETLTPLVVNTTADQNNTPAGAQLSLREAIRDCPDGGRITFAPALNGAVLAITSQLQFDAKAISIEATGLPRGITVNRGGSGSRVFNVQASAALSLHAVSSTGGAAGLSGGGIRNAGRLVMTRAAVHGNTGAGGGGIVHLGPSMTLEHCTLSGNTSTSDGGALLSSGQDLRIAHCTIAANTSATGAGGIDLDAAPLFLTHTILEENRRGATLANFAADVGTVFTSGGWNMENGSTLPARPQDVQNKDAGLLPLNDNGGYSRTHALAADAFARDAGSPAASARGGTDQRGWPRTAGAAGLIDLGAFEAGGYSDWALASIAAGRDREFLGDADGDGVVNGLEYKAALNPALHDASALPQPAVQNIGGVPTAVLPVRYRSDRSDALLTVQHSPDLLAWQDVHPVLAGASPGPWLISDTGSTLRTALIRAAGGTNPPPARSWLRLSIRQTP